MRKLISLFTPAILIVTLFLAVTCKDRPWPPGMQQISEDSPFLSPEEALKTFFLPPGYWMELVASEPLVEDPVAIDFDADGQLWVAEMRGFMPNIGGKDEKRPVGRIVVLRDFDGDGRMDSSTVFLDSLVLPRAVRALDHGVLVAAPPYLWQAFDTTGDLRADVVEVIRSDYGDPNSNPAFNANGLMWGLDNWVHSTMYQGRLRLRNRVWEHEPTLQRGQWGISQDDHGRIFRNANEDPLRVDLIPAHYFHRNPNLTHTAGVYERAYENRDVWPVRPTRGANRGYLDNVLREDGRLATFTAAGAPTVFLGDRLPEELHNNVFVIEPVANLVRRFVISETDDGRLMGRNPYHEVKADFLTSTDERFRPVNLYSAPDGTLYVVDMYRGVIEHSDFITDYLKEHISKRGLDRPLGLGRIYRIRYKSMQPSVKPQLSQKTPFELVDYLSHANGWWRFKAQQLIVERNDRSAAPAIRRLLRNTTDERARLHGLWTLEGLDEVDPETILYALSDDSPHVRASAIRISEPLLTNAGHPIGDSVSLLIRDAHPIVRRQLAASLGCLPEGERTTALTTVLAHYGQDPILVDLVISALQGLETIFLDSLLHDQTLASQQEHLEEPIRVLTETILNAREKAGMRRIFDWISDETRPQWQRLALLDGIEHIVFGPGGTRPQLFRLEEKPGGLIELAGSSRTEMAVRAKSLLRHIVWQGKKVRPLTREELRSVESGQVYYKTACAACHMEDGTGIEGYASPLIGSKRVLGDPGQLTRILLQGLEGDMSMPPAPSASDEEIAAVLSYIRRSWGHSEDPVDRDFVMKIRRETAGRERPWTHDELDQVKP